MLEPIQFRIEARERERETKGENELSKLSFLPANHLIDRKRSQQRVSVRLREMIKLGI